MARVRLKGFGFGCGFGLAWGAGSGLHAAADQLLAPLQVPGGVPLPGSRARRALDPWAVGLVRVEG